MTMKASEITSADCIDDRLAFRPAELAVTMTLRKNINPERIEDHHMADIEAMLGGDDVDTEGEGMDPDIAIMLPPFHFKSIAEKGLMPRFDRLMRMSICATVADMIDSANIGPDDVVAIVGCTATFGGQSVGFYVPEIGESNNFERLSNCRKVLFFPGVYDSAKELTLGQNLFAKWLCQEKTRSTPCIPDVVINIPSSMYHLVFEGFGMDQDRIDEGASARGIAMSPRNLAWFFNLCHAFKVPYVSSVCWDGMSCRLSSKAEPIDDGFEKKYWHSMPSNNTAYRHLEWKDDSCPSSIEECQWMESAFEDETIVFSYSHIVGHDVIVMNPVTVKELEKSRKSKTFVKNKVPN
jgi:hypothetical protein